VGQYNYKKTEKKWAEKWVRDKTFTPDLSGAKNPYYALFMFPYPSAEGLHIGNFYAFTCVDVMAKYKKLQGFDVFEPIGFDAFGLHSENYALTIGETPRKMLRRTEENFRKQLKMAGLGCDWTREVDTANPNYYKWTQWIFTKLFERGLAVRKESLVHWCPGCKTVLADEQIENGVCERCGSISEKKKMKQWFFKITDYAQRILDGLNEMDWSEITKAAQKNWIGRSEGAIIKFEVQPPNIDTSAQFGEVEPQYIEVFTTRPDTLFGVTYFVLSPEHNLVRQFTTDEQREEVEKYIKDTASKSDLDRMESKEKTGVFTGAYVINPVNNEKIPVWVADYVLMGYGTGAIMAVPAHDERDWEFAKKYDLPIKKVVEPPALLRIPRNIEDIAAGAKEEIKIEAEYWSAEGVNINSEFLNGLATDEAKKKMTEWLKEKNLGRANINYKLRDWCISRQRYWGPPIPVIYCEKCGIVSVPEKDLPVLLPDLEKEWEPAGDGKGPLSKVDSFVKTECPKCGKPAKRETDVMDNFLDSAWYYYRYLSPENGEEIFDKKIGDKWLPVDFYVGGNEHAVLHLMYTRFITMLLRDLDVVDFDNPFKRFRANGMILKDGKKMSKSKGNVVNPEEYGEKVGYDALKSYLLFLGPFEENRSFSDEGILGTMRWVDKIYRLKDKVKESAKDGNKVLRNLHKTIKRVSEDFEGQKYNTAIARLMEMTNVLSAADEISRDTWLKFLALTAPFLPALAEEMWERAGNKSSIFGHKNWPEYDLGFVREDEFELVVQVNGKLRGSITAPRGINEKEAEKKVRAEEKFKKYLENRIIKKTIFVKNRLINFVIDK